MNGNHKYMLPKSATLVKKYVARSALKSKKLHSKPKCPCCGKPLFFWYGAKAGLAGICMKCPTCTSQVYVDLDTGEISHVVDDAMLEMN